MANSVKFNRTKRVIAAVERGRKKAALQVAMGIESDIKLAMAEPKSGRMYGTHQASAPGEAPAVDTGALRASIHSDETGNGAIIATNQEYAPHLEFGTRHMEPRPVWLPAAERARQSAPGLVMRIIREEVMSEV